MRASPFLFACLAMVACDPANLEPSALDTSDVDLWDAGTSLYEVMPEDGLLAPPVQTLSLAVSQIVPGQDVTFTVTGLNAGERVWIVRSNDGIGDGFCPPPGQGLCLDIAGTPLITANDFADPSGTAAITLTAPANLPQGLEIAFQALAFRGPNSTRSNAVLTTVVSGGPGLASRPANPTCVAPDRPSTTASVRTTRVFQTVTGLSTPTVLVQPPNDGQYWYVGQQNGTIKRFDPSLGSPTASTVLSIPGVTAGGELGLLAIAFDPEWPADPYMYTYYTTGSGSTLRSRISRWTTTNGGASWGSQLTILEQNQPFSNHNGGNLAFDQDGYLVFGFGDGGSANDPQNHGQNPNTLLGAFIRIDVSNATAGDPYDIPPDNPYANGGGRPEIFAIGVRNPYRWSFDRATGLLWMGDVGQNAREEIAIVQLGENHGWRVREGTLCTGLSSSGNPPCNSPVFTQPVWEYAHSGFSSYSVIGGYVYRGSAIPALAGKYLYAEFYTGEIFAVSQNSTTGNYTSTRVLTTGQQISTFAEDVDGEVYFLTYGGAIFRIDENVPAPSTFPALLSETGCFDPVDPSQPVPAMIPYEPRAQLWSDGLTKRRWLAVPDGTTIDTDADGDMLFPIGTVLAKEFSWQGERVETRLFVRHADGDWGAYDYKWLPDGSDAALLTAGQDIVLDGGLPWRIPSQGECFACHTTAANRSLGLEIAQLNQPVSYGGVWANQLDTLDHVGLLTTSPGPADSNDALALLRGPESDEARARAYLHSNCSMCHRPGGTGLGAMDMRWFTPLVDMNVCDVNPTSGTGGIANVKRFSPGLPNKSMLYLRMLTTDLEWRMPATGTTVPHDEALAAVAGWIDGVTACP